MAFDFPASPVEGQEFLAPAGPIYRYVGGKWLLATSVPTASATAFTPAGDIAATNVQAAIAELAAEPKGWRNRIINGDFAIDQRWSGGQANVAATTQVYAMDRWVGLSGVGTTGAFSIYRAADPYFNGGYVAQLYVTTADASLAANDYYDFQQRIEGYFVRDLWWGAAGALPITISFTVYNSIAATVTLPLSVRNAATNRSWLGSFTLAAGATTKVVMTVPGDVTGTWDKGNLVGMNVSIGLGDGSTFQGVPGWQSGNFVSLPGMSNFMATIGNQIFIKDFQVELGSVATEFERVAYDEQLARCQRYYTNGYARFDGYVTTSYGYTSAITFPCHMRAIPTITQVNTGNVAFPATPGNIPSGVAGFFTYRSANATGGGAFNETWAVSAEL